MTKQLPGQLNIPAPNEIGTQHDPDAAYESTYGSDAARAQREAYKEARRCTCGSAHPNRWGTRWGHRVGCPRAGKRF